MPFTESTLAEVQEAPFQTLHASKISFTPALGRTSSAWFASGVPATGSLSTSAISCDRATAGALRDMNNRAMQNSVSGERAVRIALRISSMSAGGLVCLCDRVSQIAGLNATTTGAVAVNLPAPTRYTVGAESRGIMAAVEIHTTIGATATTCNMSSYTNQDGVAGRVGPLIDMGGATRNGFSRLIQLPVDGDFGVRSVESFTLTASTGTAGAYAVCTYKPLVCVPIHQMGPVSADRGERSMGFVLPRIPNGACLFYMILPATSGATGAVAGDVYLGEE